MEKQVIASPALSKLHLTKRQGRVGVVDRSRNQIETVRNCIEITRELEKDLEPEIKFIKTFWSGYTNHSGSEHCDRWIEWMVNDWEWIKCQSAFPVGSFTNFKNLMMLRIDQLLAGEKSPPTATILVALRKNRRYRVLSTSYAA